MSKEQSFGAVVFAALVVASAVTGSIALSRPAAAAVTTSQLDFSGIYNADVVAGTNDLTPGDFDNTGYSMVSSSWATFHGFPSVNGLPDDGVFPAEANVHPQFDLADFDTDDSNAWQTTTTGSVTADVANGQYETVHVVASVGGAGPWTPAKFRMDLHYADGSTASSQEFAVPDWFGTPPSAPGYAVRDGMDRWDSPGSTYDPAHDAAIWGFAVPADSSRTLTAVTIDVTENQAGAFNFFGGAATTQQSSLVNHAPTASDDWATTDEDASVTVDVVANDVDSDGDSLSVSGIQSGPASGSAAVVSNQIRYVPDADWNGVDSLTYEVSDGNGGTDTATLTVSVNAVNDPPVASDDSATTDEDTGVTVDAVANDADVDGDPLAVTAVTTGPSHGTAQITGRSDDQIRYVPDADWNGVDSLTYEVSDGNGGTDTAALSVTVAAVDDAPVASDGTATTDEDTPVTIPDGNSTDLLELATDVDGDTLSLDAVAGTSFSSGSVVTLGSGATVVAYDNGSWTYDPSGQFGGLGNGDTALDSFTYAVADGNGGTAQGTVTVTVTGVPDRHRRSSKRAPPVADAGPDRSVGVGERVTFDAGSSQNTSANSFYRWYLHANDRTYRSGETVEYAFDAPGTYTVTLEVTSWTTDSDTVNVTVAARPATTPANATETPEESGTPKATSGQAETDTPTATSRPAETDTPTATSRPVGTTAQTTASQTAAATDRPDQQTTSVRGPGLGVPVAVLALLASAWLLARRRN